MNIKQIPDFPNYYITDEGEVYNSRGLRMTLQTNIDGYNVVNLYSHGKPYHKRVCRLVAEGFLEGYSEFLVVNHKDLDKKNDYVANLEMTTILENTRHSIENQPLMHKGRSSVSLQHISYIYRLMADGLTNNEISAYTGLARGLLSRVRSGQTWAGCQAHYDIPEPTRKIDSNLAETVCINLSEVKSPAKVYKLMSGVVSLDIIKDIKRRKIWKHISVNYYW
jgi:hypothetical protein